MTREVLKFCVVVRPKRKYTFVVKLGGEGSGNHGHAGRPGEVGGSASDGTGGGGISRGLVSRPGLQQKDIDAIMKDNRKSSEVPFWMEKVDNELDVLFREGRLKDDGEFVPLTKSGKLQAQKKLADFFEDAESSETWEITRRDSIMREWKGVTGKEVEWEDIPKRVMIYRGSKEVEDLGSRPLLNFSLSRDVAKRFSGVNGVLSEYMVHKDDIDFAFEGGPGFEESEVFVRDPGDAVELVKSNMSTAATAIEKFRTAGLYKKKTGFKVQVGDRTGVFKLWGVGSTAVVEYPDGSADYRVPIEEVKVVE